MFESSLLVFVPQKTRIKFLAYLVYNANLEKTFIIFYTFKIRLN